MVHPTTENHISKFDQFVFTESKMHSSFVFHTHFINRTVMPCGTWFTLFIHKRGSGPLLDRLLSSHWWRCPRLQMKSLSGYSVKINKSQNEGTAKGIISTSVLMGIFFGMHYRKNSWEWENKYNKYCSKQYLLLLEITKCRALLSLPDILTALLCVKGH